MTKRKLNNKIKKVRVSSKRVFYIRFRPVAQKWFFPIVLVIFSVACIDHWYSNRGTWVFENVSAAVYDETNLIETAQTVSGGLGVSGTMANTTASVAVPTGGTQVSSVSGSVIEVSIRETFPEDPGTALAIAKGESGLDPYAIGYNCHYYKENGKRYSASCKKEDIGKHWSVDCGLWQINIIAKECPKHLFNPEVNTQEARKKYDTVWNGVQRKWSPWVAYWNGQYKNHMN
jgi:hypothetical protein